VHLFDLVTRKLLRTLKGHTHGVSLAFSPNSKYLVSGSRDRTVQFWDLTKPSPAPKPAFVLKRAAIPPVHCIAWSPDGKLVAAGDNEGNITFFDGSDPNGFAEIPNLYMKKAHELVVSSLDFSPDSKRLVTGGFDKKVKVWTLPERPAGN
jgi:WD40 repeat protein